MADTGEVEAEYESEPEGSVLLWSRSKASDDDDEGNRMDVAVRLNRSVRRIGDADESDCCEGAPEYYDDDYDDDDEEVSYIDEFEKLGEVEEYCQEKVAGQVPETKHRGKEKEKGEDADAFVVPRDGAFYMHDDRFSGLRRRSRGRRRKKNIWEPRVELIWMHDKYEEMTMEETYTKDLKTFEVHRTSNNYHQGRKKSKSKSGGPEAKYRPFSKSGNNSSSSVIVKGRGPVRYKPLSRRISVNPAINSMQEKTQGTGSKEVSASSANNKQRYRRPLGKTESADYEIALSTKCKQSVKQFQKPGNTDSSKSMQSRSKGSMSFTDTANVNFHGLNAANYESRPSDQHILGPSMSSYLQALFPYSVPGSTCMTSPESRGQGTGLSLSIPFTQQMPADSAFQPPSQVSTQHLHSHFLCGPQKLYEASSSSFLEPGIFESGAYSVQANIASLEIGSNICPPQCTGIQGDQIFNATPVLFPVMPVGALHPGTVSGPAIDMSSTGYVGASQVHRNPNLTWLPYLRPAAGAIGPTCQPPFVASDINCYGNLMPPPFVDIASYAKHTSIPSNEAVSSGTCGGSLASMGNDYFKKTASPRQVSNERGKQSFKPTRYSRMNIKE